MNNELEVTRMEQEGATALEQAIAFQITTNDDYLEVDTRIVALNAYKKKVKAHFEDGPNGEKDGGPVPLAYAAWKAVVALRDKLLNPAELAARAYKQKIWEWDKIQEEKRKAQEAELQQKAKKLEEDRQLAEAQLAEDAGDRETAQAIVAAPVQVPVVVLPKAVPKRTSIVRTIRKFRIKDSSKINRTFLIPDQTSIGAIVRAKGKDAEAVVGGIEVYEEAA